MNKSGGENRMKYAWFIVALLMPVALLNYLDRQMLAAMKFSLMTDIPDIGSEANWGKILALFKWTYAFLSPVGGYLADRFSRRHLIAFSLAIWSAITWATRLTRLCCPAVNRSARMRRITLARSP